MNHRLTITSAIATLAASMALIPLLSGGKWFFAGLGAIIVTAAVGTATRHRALRALPAVVCLLCALVALVLYLNLVYASPESYLRLFPSPRSLGHLWHSSVTGLRAAQKLSAPVPPIPGLEFLASGGIGLVAVLTDLIAVRLRRSALAGLPLLVLFSVPVATNATKNTTESVVFFCVGMAGYLTLLSADGRERLRLWGRLVTPWNAAHPNERDGEVGSGPSARALAASGRRIGLAAVVLALFVPVLIPGLHAHKLFHGSGSGPGHGPGGNSGGVNATVNPLVQMTHGLQQAKPSVVFTYRTNDPHPQYLVEYVLNQLTATQASWVPPRNSMVTVTAGQPLPRVPGLESTVPVRQVRTTVQMKAADTLGNSWLPMPYAPRVLTVPNNGLKVDPATLQVFSPLANLNGVSYTVNSVDVTPTDAQIATATVPASGMSSYLYVPTPLRSLGTLAHQIVEGASTPYRRAVALQGWLVSKRFTYDVHATEPDNSHALYDFLYKTKKGYCQQFSFAMTVLARLLGIPARVVVGYDQGTPVGHGQYDVETSDEHAWTQLYFTGLGWTTWDPTPAGPGVGQTNVGPPTYTAPAGSNGPGGGSPAPPTGGGAPHGNQGPFNGRASNDRIRAVGVPLNQKLSAGEGGVAAGLPGISGSGGDEPVLLMVLAALLLAALVAPRISRTWTRRRRAATRGDASRAHAAWAEFLDDLEDFGIEYGPGETPRTLAKRITGRQKLGGDPRAALDRLARAEELASYAREPGPASTLTADLVTVRTAVAGSVTPSARWRARLMPMSSAGRLRQLAAQALDVFGSLEMAVTRLGARLRARTRQA